MRNFSVLNTDSFDKRRFKEIFEISAGLQKVRREGTLPMFEHLLADIWAALYKMKPEITVSDIDDTLWVNRLLMERMMRDECFVNYRNFTRLDELSSAIGTVKFGEKTNQWLTAQTDEILHSQLQELHAIQRKYQKQEQTGNGNESSEENFSEVKIRFHEKFEQMLHNNRHSFSQAMEQAMQETKQLKDDLKSLLGGYSAGSGEAELKKLPLRDQISLAEKIASNKKMKEIADWAGRFKQVAHKKQRPKKSESVERSGITLGNDVESLLPIELSLYTHPLTRLDFLRRLVEGQTMQYEQKSKEVLGKGPIVLCLDQSGSMQRLDTQSKGFALALMSIAQKQRRDFCLILFSNQTQIFNFDKGKIKSADMIHLAQTFLGGGTNFVLPLDGALNIINESRFNSADIVFVTDGEAKVTNSFIETFNRKKREKDFHVLSLVIGVGIETVKQFTDRVIQINDFNEKGSFTAFEI